MSYMLSARVTRDREAGILSMDQSAAITRVAQKCGVDKDSRKWGTPLAVGPLEKQAEKTIDCDRVYGQEFCQILRYGFSQFERYVFAFIEERRCQIMIGVWKYVISEMGFEMPRDVEVNGFHLRFCNCTNLFVRRSKDVAESIE